MSKQTLNDGATGLQSRTKINEMMTELYTLTAFQNKPEGEPIFFVVLSQSQAPGQTIGTTEAMPAVDGVQQWATTGSGSHGWRDFDGDAAELADYTAAPNDAYCGHPRGGRGTLVYSLSKYLKEANPDRDVYFLLQFQNGAPALQWADGATNELLATQEINDALASAELTAAGITYPDFVLVTQSGSNANYKSAFQTSDKTYAEQWLANIANFETDWADAENTRWFFADAIYEWNHEQAYDTSQSIGARDAIEPWRWSGIYKLHQLSGGKIRIIPSKGYPFTYSDDLHYTGDGCLQFGRDMGPIINGQATAHVPAPLRDIAADPAGDVSLAQEETTDATPVNVISIPLNTGGEIESFEVNVYAKRTDDVGALAFYGKLVALKDASPEGANLFAEEAKTPTASTATVTTLVFAGTFIVQVTGVASQDWTWYCEVKHRIEIA